MKKICAFLVWGNGQNLEKKRVIWNMVFNLLSTMQSTVMVLAATRMAGTDEAGMVSIAFAAGYLMYMAAAFGVRNFQATDTNRMYSFKAYRNARFLTYAAALTAGVIYICMKYTGEKQVCVLCIGLLKTAEAVEDLYHGELQRKGRLDAACRLGAARLLLNYVVFFGALACSDFMTAVFIVTVQSVLIVLLECCMLDGTIGEGNMQIYARKDIWGILKECFPLFMMAFLNVYICNVPKYAIDTYLTDQVQAYFAVLYMPIFSINLFSSMIYGPQVVKLSVLWNMDRKKFEAEVKRQSLYICGVTIFVIAGGLTAGIYILEFLYGLALENYRFEFALLLAGGGAAAFYNFFSICLIIIRRQKQLIWITGAAVLEAIAVSGNMVLYGGIAGASGLYLLLMISELFLTVFVLKRHVGRII